MKFDNPNFYDKTAVRSIFDYSPVYPKNLLEIHEHPRQIFVKGADFNNDSLHVAIVGTRMPSEYGAKLAYEIAHAITSCGGVVVSGLAFGIDSICHKASVDLNKPTIAVLGSGINNITPRSNESLAFKILDSGGTIVSEFSNESPSYKYRYVRRNRIISGICKYTIVIEAGEKSGALITANFAFEQNRDVFSLIGDIDRIQNIGCRKLIEKDIAKPICSIDSLLKDIGLDFNQSITEKLDLNTVSILNFLKSSTLNEASIEHMSKNLKLHIHDILSSLTILEMYKLVVKKGPNLWSYNIDNHF